MERTETRSVVLQCSSTLLALFPLVPGLRAPQGDVSDLARWTTSELIDHLPRIGEEYERQPDVEWWVPRPAVAELRRRLIEETRLTDDEWQRALVRSAAIRMRERWPVDAPLALSIRIPAWLGVAQIKLTPQEGSLSCAYGGVLAPSGCGTCDAADTAHDRYQELGSLPLGRHRLVFDAVVERGDAALFFLEADPEQLPKPGILWGGELALDVEIVPSARNVVPPVTSPELDAAITAAIGIGFIDQPNGDSERTAILVFEPSLAGKRLLETTALSLSIELRRDGRYVQFGRMVVTENSSSAAADRAGGSSPRRINVIGLPALSPACEQPGPARGGWTLVIRGTSAGIERAWGTRGRWAGTIEIPLEDAIEREAARVGREGRRLGWW
jgi:hypothetical protein